MDSAVTERGSALWGNGGSRKRFAVAALLVLACVLAAARPAEAAKPKALVPQDLYAQALANPAQLFDVIVQAAHGRSSAQVGADVASAQRTQPGVARGLKRTFRTIAGASATLSGAQLVALADSPAVGVITPDTATESSGLSNVQIWPDAAQLTGFWPQADAGSLQAPTIAVMDSGVQADNPAFGGRVLTQVSLYSGTGANGAGDGLGHGTFAAGIAAGADEGHAGGVPNAKIVSLDVLGDDGSGSTSDMIAACDWIQANKDAYGIRVVNISIVGSQNSSFLYDPLDKAVEKLWLNGVVVVAAVGNYAQDGAESGVPFAPANDPFVITVGATDTNGSVGTADDFAAPWSAWGATNDGFFKPEISAPGRVLYGPVPADGEMMALHPERQVAPGYMWMSGTSFAAPVVSAAAAYVLAAHPSWTPDQVKGALMVSAADPAGYAGGAAMGVGVVQGDSAVATDGSVNPNLGLDQFVGTDSTTGLAQFDGSAWQTAAENDSAWNAMSWASMSWASASWSSQSWASMSWASMSWASQSWASQSWASMSWASQSWASMSWVE